MMTPPIFLFNSWLYFTIAMHFTTTLHDEAGVVALGTALAQTLKPGLAIYLYGNLGAGKTTLTRALLHASGHTGSVKSPTYTLVEPYTARIAGQTLDVMHFDLYRMIDEEEFLQAGFRDYFNAHTICIVEWPEKAATLLPPADLAIHLSVLAEGAESERQVELHALSAQGVDCVRRLKFVPNL